MQWLIFLFLMMNSFCKTIVFFCLISLFFEAKAQKYDTTYIQDLRDKYMFRINLQRAMNQVSIRDKVFEDYIKVSNDDSRLRYEPNLATSVGLGFAYKWIGFDFNISRQYQEEKLYGKSQSFDIQVNSYFRHVVSDLYYIRYKGYYLSNPAYLFPIRQATDPFPQYPEMRTESWGFSAMYIFNARKFSYQSIFTQAEIQKKSVGSWLLGLYYHKVRLDNETVFIPEEMQIYFDKASLFTQYRNQDLGIKGGFARNFIFGKSKHWIANFSMILNIGTIQKNIHKQSDIVLTQIDVSIGSDMRFAFGYSAPNWFLLMNASGKFFYLDRTASSQTNYLFGKINITYGFRLDKLFRFKKMKK